MTQINSDGMKKYIINKLAENELNHFMDRWRYLMNRKMFLNKLLNNSLNNADDYLKSDEEIKYVATLLKVIEDTDDELRINEGFHDSCEAMCLFEAKDRFGEDFLGEEDLPEKYIIEAREMLLFHEENRLYGASS